VAGRASPKKKKQKGMLDEEGKKNQGEMKIGCGYIAKKLVSDLTQTV
jgi:hypothetical protein